MTGPDKPKVASTEHPAQYAQFLQTALVWGQQWGDTAPDVVERTLFAIGKSDALAVRALTPKQPLA